MDIFDEPLLHASFERIKPTGEEIVAGLNVVVAIELDSLLERFHAMVDIVSHRGVCLGQREQDEYHVFGWHAQILQPCFAMLLDLL